MSQNDEKEDESVNIQKDLALQRLLKESHLLDSSGPLHHTGQARHRALDIRLQDLGSKASVFGQQKMPLAQRKGISAKMTERERSRRYEAKENGIILEKGRSVSRRSDSKRQKGIGAPSVGKFRGGTLTLSKNDVRQIQGPSKSTRRK